MKKSSIRTKGSKLLYAGLAGAAIMLGITAIAGYFLYDNMRDAEAKRIGEYKAKMENLQSVADQSLVAYSVNLDVEKGELISEDMLTKVYVSEATHAEDIVLIPHLTKEKEYVLYAKTDLMANTVLTKSMVYEEENITHDVREAEYSFVEIPTNIDENKYIDLRIQFPSGEDYILLSKKKIKDLSGITLRLDVLEDEILSVSSAIVDAYLENAKIYAIPYLDEHMQDKAIETYPLKENVLALLKEDPNVVNKAKYVLEQRNRLALENSLDALLDAEKEAVKSGNSNTKYNKEAVDAQIKEEERLNAINEQEAAQAAEQANLLEGE
ncbi:MAG: SAF domain-containing protein [Psychrobacillus sp.]